MSRIDDVKKEYNEFQNLLMKTTDENDVKLALFSGMMGMLYNIANSLAMLVDKKMEGEDGQGDEEAQSASDAQ